MSLKERAYNIIDQMSTAQLESFVVLFGFISNDEIEIVTPDDLDYKMIERAKCENDGSVISIEDLARDLGVTL